MEEFNKQKGAGAKKERLTSSSGGGTGGICQAGFLTIADQEISD